jgi:DNA topoisomerase-1
LSKGLVIVESPAKAKTIQKYLGKGFSVEASLGHVKDLPKSTLGVDINNDFETDYIVIPGKEKVVAKLKKLAASADNIYLAPDPDREGEAIAAHLAFELDENGSKKKKAAKKTKKGEPEPPPRTSPPRSMQGSSARAKRRSKSRMAKRRKRSASRWKKPTGLSARLTRKNAAATPPLRSRRASCNRMPPASCASA